MHILLFNCSILIVSLFSHLPVPAPRSGFHLSCPLGLCLRFLPNLCHTSRPLPTTASPTTSFLDRSVSPVRLLCQCPSSVLPLFSLLFYAHPISFIATSSPHHLFLPIAPYLLPVQCPWGSSPHPCSRCSMPPAGQAWVPWASPSSCWPTTSRWRSQRWMSITMRWTLSPTSAHGESIGNKTREGSGHAFILYFLSVMLHITLKDHYLSIVMCRKW